MKRHAPHLVILVGVLITLAFGTAGPASAATVPARWSVTVAQASLLTGPEGLGGGRVYVGFGAPDGTGGVRALDVATGATLWTCTFPLPVTVPPVFVPRLPTRLYAGTSERLYGLDPASGKTIVAGPVTRFEDLYSLHYADGRVYIADDPRHLRVHRGRNAAVGLLPRRRPLRAQHRRATASSTSTTSRTTARAGSRSAWRRSTQPTAPSWRSTARSRTSSRRAAVPSRNTVAGGGSVGVFGFRTSNLKQRWLNTRFSLGYATNATPAFGGVVAASLGERMGLLRLSDGTKLCEKTFDERSFSSILPPVFDPGSGGVYLFDQVAKDVYKASNTCQQAWVYLADDDVAGFAASSSTIVGAGGHTVFALNP